MRLALLGADDQTVAFVRDLTANTTHEVVWGTELGDHETELRQLLPRLQVGAHWESLLDRSIAAAVVVARLPDSELRIEQLRKLLQAEVPAVVMHPICEIMLLAYELEMIRTDLRGVLVPDLPDRLHPASNALRELARRGAPQLGPLEQITFERFLPDRSRAAVKAQFARDVDFLRWLDGDIARLAAQAGSQADSNYANLAVQMSGALELPLRWTVGPQQGTLAARIALVGSEGQAVLAIPAVAGEWTLTVANEAIDVRTLGEVFSPAARTLRELERAVSRQSLHGASWADACEAIELSETVQRSLKRGRTIELHDEDFSESGRFKGTMASLGCGLLVAGVVIALFIAVLQWVFRLFGWRAGVIFLRRWPLLVLGLLLVFLLLQILLSIVRPADPDPPAAEDSVEPPD
ncbi:MAG TPA: hypothetical protein VFE24_06335 [Pirellulales bacterium]|jgi:myo-inositol 2-dehydrogenase/D-chiro-inositol 1-dehydrogenase|nr:hypothetical protein [Pirellulales bacterium]